MKKLLLALALAFSISPVAAQWQVPNNTIPLGRGQGVVGFNSVAGSAGGGTKCLIDTVPPSFGTCAGTVTGVTSLSAGTGITLTPNPITSTGTIAAVGGGGGASLAFGGRLTLVSGTPEMTTDVVGAQNIYYAPDGIGNTVPVYDGTSMAARQFTSSATDQVGLTCALGGLATWPSNTIFDIFITLNGGNPVCATRQWDASMLQTAPALITPVTTASSAGSAGYITTGTTPTAWTTPGNAFNGSVHQTSASGATVPTASNNGLANCLGQSWGNGVTKVLSQVIITSPTDNPFRGDASNDLNINIYGSNDNSTWFRLDQHYIADATNTSFTIPINISYTTAYQYHLACIAGNNTNAARVSQLQFYTTAGPSTRRIAKYNGILVNDALTTSTQICSNAACASVSATGIAQYQGTLVGSFQTDAATNGSVTAHVNFGPSRVYNLWNAYNQKTITLRAGLISVLNGGGAVTGSNNYTLTTPANLYWGACQSSAYSMSVLIGYAYEPLTVNMTRSQYLQSATGGAGYIAGIGVDTTLSPSGTEYSTTMDTGSINSGWTGQATVTLPPFFGSHTFTCIEQVAYPLNTGTISLFMNVLNAQMIASWKG